MYTHIMLLLLLDVQPQASSVFCKSTSCYFNYSAENIKYRVKSQIFTTKHQKAVNLPTRQQLIDLTHVPKREFEKDLIVALLRSGTPL